MTRLRAVAALMVLALTGCTSLGMASTDGPIPTPDDHGYGGFPVTVGEPVTDYFQILSNHGDKPARITSVELIDTPRQLKLVDALIGGERTENRQFEPQFPPTHSSVGPLVPAEGAVLEPEAAQEARGVPLTGYVLVMGLEATEPGTWVRGGYRVSYEVAGRPYELEVVAEVTLCTDDFLEADGSCPMEES
ncbi:hypothetical protein [Ornithinimicrobium pekingense]|uniref:Uncharacterized protein n=1 Tax=Ornithinimicrobium pekingense TaxID=384677 RepID=A0ABQ2FCJ0_9MICO|nr:hypothetical protein [Ornithinimicrobium pekingense]GGK83479.1 hypothetical protein GCM10011509_34890 [Ornithinimicrobium pekingense]